LKITEENFVAQLKMRNQEALAYVIEHYAWVLKTVIKKHLRCLPNLYEECLNDCLWAVWNHIDAFDPARNSFKNWVGAIAKYKSIDYLRKYVRELEHKNIEGMAIPVEDQALKVVLTGEIEEETEKILSRLPQETREIFRQLYLEEKNLQEVAEIFFFSRLIMFNLDVNILKKENV